MVGTSGFTRHAVKVGQVTARGYTTKPIKGSIAFKCAQCEYSVTTLDFQTKDGNARTQAATAVNEYAVSVHHQPMLGSSPHRQRDSWAQSAQRVPGIGLSSAGNEKRASLLG